MKTRYTSLLKIKKNDLDRSEKEFQKANQLLYNAQTSLQEAYSALEELHLPDHGKIQDMLLARAYISAQRKVVEDKKNWVAFAQNQLEISVMTLKKSNIEYEKFKYLQLQESKLILKKRHIQESKDLDEVAMMTYTKRADH